jgi:uncharacterized protein (TIGR02300 family)
MVDPKLGTKRSCEACEAKFYDLNKSPATCPICGHVFDPDAIAAAPAPVRSVAPTAEAEKKDDDGELDEDDNAVSLEGMVDEETDDSDDEDETLLEEDEALLDDNDEDETLLEDDEDDDESFLETDQDDD